MMVSSDFVVACYVPNQYNRTAANNSISDNPIATTVLSRPFSGDNAASNATFSKIQNWMTECSKSHVHCQRRPENRSTQSLKARWLDLAHSKVSGLVALDSAEHLSTPPKYAALSYVWGRSQSLSIHQTTTANLQSHAHGLVLASMPKTVQDAILVCAKLELQYLWIDRYCIVQDDPKDVTEQLSIMPQIYANAEITISAAVAEDMDAGFLQDYDQLSNRDLYTLPVDRSKSSSHQSNICLRPTIASRPNDPADTRAWCLQESLLSARLLIYGTTQLRWACREMQAIDGGPEYIAYHPAVPMSEKPPRYVADIYPVLKSADWSWARIVTEYSCRKLTYPSDKLNALAAVAEKFHTRGSTDGMAPIYLAGLWHKVDDPSTLADLLMWTAVSNGSTEEIGIASFMAPSWSWASYVGGWIKYDISHSPNLERSFKVEEAACTPLDNHLPFGTTKSGFIKCFGLVQKSQLQHNGDHWILHSSSSPSLDLLPRFDRTYALTKMLRMYESVFCLVLIRGHAWRGNMAGLLLVTNEDGTFRRVGIWEVNWKTLEKDITKAWLNAFDEQTLVLV